MFDDKFNFYSNLWPIHILLCRNSTIEQKFCGVTPEYNSATNDTTNISSLTALNSTIYVLLNNTMCFCRHMMMYSVKSNINETVSFLDRIATIRNPDYRPTNQVGSRQSR